MELRTNKVSAFLDYPSSRAVETVVIARSKVYHGEIERVPVSDASPGYASLAFPKRRLDTYFSNDRSIMRQYFLQSALLRDGRVDLCTVLVG